MSRSGGGGGGSSSLGVRGNGSDGRARRGMGSTRVDLREGCGGRALGSGGLWVGFRSDGVALVEGGRAVDTHGLSRVAHARVEDAVGVIAGHVPLASGRKGGES